jgi:aminopeptidase-like protein
MPHNCWLMMRDEFYRVDIDSDLGPGYLTYGELFLPGETAQEVLITAHICHPSLANDNLSGLAVGTALAIRQAQRKRRFGYRFLFIPATFGAIAWLARNEPMLDALQRMVMLTAPVIPGPSTISKAAAARSSIELLPTCYDIRARSTRSYL